jgi:hypothetical protein
MVLNAWIVERWYDDLLYWNPARFGRLSQISLPKDSCWIPDTTIYNSLIMDEAESKRLINVKITTIPKKKTALVELLYPTLYKISCLLDLTFFPFDIQACKMTMGSWTHDNRAINYFPYNGSNKPAISTKHCLSNEEWNIVGTKVIRSEVKFDCCKNNYTLLDFYIHIQRKPLFYLVNLIAPTGIITLIAIVGFFSSPTVNDVREEKMTLGITTLLSMSILLFMISDKMPSMGSSVPLIGWFYASNMTLIGTATLAASIVIYTQKKGIVGHRPSRSTMKWARRVGKMLLIKMPLLMLQAYALKAKQEKMKKQESQRKMSVWQRWQKIGKELRKPPTGANASLMEENSPSRKTTVEMNPRDLIKLKKQRFKRRSITELTLGSINSEAMRYADEEQQSSEEDKSFNESNNVNGSIGGMEHQHFSNSRTTSFSSPHQIHHINKTYFLDNNNEYFNGEGLIDLQNLTALQKRNLAQIEWDWIAAVIERGFLILFLILFFCCAIGVLIIGAYYCFFATID